MIRCPLYLRRFNNFHNYMRIQLCSTTRKIDKVCNGSFCLLPVSQKGFKTLPALNITNVNSNNKNNEPPSNKKSYNSIILGLLVVAASAVWYFIPFSKKDAKEMVKSNKLQSPKIVRIPENSTDIPKEVPYLIIGGGTAAFSAFRSIKSSDPKAKVLMITNEEYFPYMRPPLSKELWTPEDDEKEKYMFKQWNGSVRSVYYEPETFYTNINDLLSSEKGGVAVARGWSVNKLNTDAHQAILDDGSVITYGRCLIATGARPKPLPVFEKASKEVQDHVYYLRTLSDFNNLKDAITNVKDIVIVGGGLLGSELACTLSKQNDKKITQVFKEEGNLKKVVPKFLSLWIKDQIAKTGVKMISSSEIVGAERVNNQIVLRLSNGNTIETDVCIAATGAAPNIDLAHTSHLEVDPVIGGFVVNSELQARTDLFVAGDAASFYDSSTGRRERIEHHDHAVVSGRLAGENMATGDGRTYSHRGMFWSDLTQDLSFEALGRIDAKLSTYSVFPTPSTEGSAEEFSKGVIFYLNESDGTIVGILLWNLFNRLPLARQILKAREKYDDLNEVAKLFSIYFED